MKKLFVWRVEPSVFRCFWDFLQRNIVTVVRETCAWIVGALGNAEIDFSRKYGMSDVGDVVGLSIFGLNFERIILSRILLNAQVFIS